MFCRRGSHEYDLGDLFGPYILPSGDTGNATSNVSEMTTPKAATCSTVGKALLLFWTEK